ncbi:SpaA isopeptide-forming pilin-related protein [Clostridium thermobutyricum]|uniref:Cna protein B-type domain protein n=1 Tax=Clostridium thermobutyricum DSM 4928 TaxID=1121339 RepID=A0A1V4SU95_9CLOT|nr:SpaA isopeptide-forming pilin-related protein [Clostridium thermobutyricum]OPX46861.1 Cna protein B-type domain protein [Clostridium thermobutyricum DSM 4928]
MPKVFKDLKVLKYPDYCFGKPIIKGNTLTLVANGNITHVVNGYFSAEATFNDTSNKSKVDTPININGKAQIIHINVPNATPNPGDTDSGKTDSGSGTGQGNIVHINKTVNGQHGFNINNLNSSNNTFNFKVEINTHGINGESTFKDNMLAAFQLVKGSLSIYKVTPNGNVNVTNKFLKYSTINNTSIEIKNIPQNENYIIYYKGTIPLKYANNFTNRYGFAQNNATLNQYSSSVFGTFRVDKISEVTSNTIKGFFSKTVNNQFYSNVGDIKTYTLNVNPQNYLIKSGAIIKDKMPEGLELNSFVGANMANSTNQFIPYNFKICEITKDGTYKVLNPSYNPMSESQSGSVDGVITLNYQTNELTIQFNKDTTECFALSYTAKVDKLLNKITNTAEMSVDNLTTKSSRTINFSSNSGLIQVWKTVGANDNDQGNISYIYPGQSNDVLYELHVQAYGIYPANYLNLEDDLPVGVILKSIEVPKGFSYKIDGNKIYVQNDTIINSKISSETKVIKIECSLKDVPDGTTTYNSLKYNNNVVSTVQTKKGYAFSAIKAAKNSQTSNKITLQGAVYGVYNSDGKLLYKVTSGENGEIHGNINSTGNYYLQELQAPKGYLVNNTPIPFSIEKSNIGTTLNLGYIYDSKIPTNGGFTIQKLSSNGAKLEGAEFTVTGPDGFKRVVTTNTDGIVKLTDIPLGTYTIKETKAPLGYSLNPNIQSFTINAENATKENEVTFKDTQILGDLQIIKTNSTGSKNLQGAEFDVSGPNGFNKIATTNTDGVANLNNLPWGTYTVKEIKAPLGYNLNNESQTVQVTSASVGQIQSLTFKDTQTLGKLNITKTGKDGVKLQGAEFTVTGSNGFNKVVTTNTEGVASLNNLQWGTYTIKETKAPQGYELNNKAQTITINSEDASQVQDLTFNDSQILGQLSILKTGANGYRLPGAEFKVIGQNGFNKVVTTNREGIATLNNLQWGTYTVQEIKAPKGYNLNNKPQTVVINSNDVSKANNLTFVDSEVLGNLTIEKLNESGYKLAGAEFNISGPNGFNRVVTTNTEGVASLNNLQWGTYTIKETKAPQGYELNNKTQTITINSNNTSNLNEIVFKDSKILGSLQITKTNENGKEKLAGAEFNISGPNGFNRVVTTNTEGVASLNNLQWGTYTIKEIKAPQGYELNNKTQTISIDSNNVISTQNLKFADVRLNGSIKVTKLGKDGVKLSGAEFTITGANNFRKVITTDINGVATLNNLPWGNYTIKETKAPQGYKLSNKTQTVTINSNDVSQIQSITFNDTQILGKLNITKTGKNSFKLQGAEFTVTGPNGFSKVVTTNNEGVASLDNLQWGTYTIKETKAPLGYKLSDKAQIITINSNDVLQVQGVTFNDSQILGQLNIIKTGKDGVKLAGAKFKVTGQNGFNEIVTTNKEGLAALSNLPWGTYTIKEVKAPLGYNLNNEIKTVQITSASVGQVQSLTFNDTQILGKLNITKIGKDGVKLSGAQFTISGPNGFNKTVTTNKEGVASLSNLQWGTYRIKETKAPLGYKLNSEVQTIVINSNDVSNVQSITVVDGQETGNITITKEGLNKEKLAGAIFEITGPNGFNREVTTGDNGSVSLNGLAWGTYTIKEIKAPQGYELNYKPQTVNINAKTVNLTQGLTFTDIRLNGSIKVTKLGKDGVKLSGAEFTITGANNFKKVITTDINGVATLNNLPWGTYSIKETKAPIGYKLSDKTQTVNINSNDVSQIQGVTFNDTQILGKLSIIKTGKDGVKLQGAEFTVTGPNGFNETVTTNKEGVASLSNLPWGTYSVKEIKAPEGYNLNKTVKTVQVTNESVGQIQSLTFNDTQILGNLNITKLGKNGAKLEGAKFTISSSNGFNETVTTNKEGVASLSNLPWGTYKIKETKAPQGYKLNDKIQTITINSSDVSQVQSLTFNDTQILGELSIIKTGKDGIRLEGAKFNITGPNGFNKIVTTNKNGIAILDNLQWGTYSVKEIKAPQGYNLNDKVQTIQVTSENVGTIQSLTFNDTQILGKLTITKIGKDGVKLEGAKFKVTGPNGFNKIVTTNIDGIASLDNLQWGTYSIKEIKAPQNYSLNNKVFNITINSKDAYQFLSIKDKLNSKNIITSYDNKNNKSNFKENNINKLNNIKNEITNYNNKNNKIENVAAKNSSKTNIENNNSQSNTESPKTGDASELPIIILLGFAVATLILINKGKILNSKK